MKKICFYIISNLVFLLLFIINNIYADEIHLKSGILINGKILRVTAEFIEYDPAGNRPFDMIPRDQVEKIVYDDGSFVNFNENKSPKTEKAMVQDDKSDEKDIVIEMDRKPSDKEPERRLSGQNKYVEFESGWNGYVGALGARFDYRVFNSFTLNAGMGAGLWGYRLSAGTRYFIFDYPFGPAFGLGIAYNTGAKDVELDAKLEDSSGNTYNDKLVFDFKPVAVVNITFLYGFKVGTKNKIYVETGYGIRLSKDNYTYRLKDSSQDVVLSQEAKDQMDVLQPGGIIISIGFALAI